MKRKKWIIAALASMSLVFGFLGFTLNAQADVASFFSMDGELNACYFVGETLSIPSAKFVVDGEDIQADTIINGPDNRAYRARDTIELTVPGEYELEYRAYSSGELLSEKRSFSVKNTIYTFSGEKNSSFEYGLDSSAYQTEIMGLRTSIGMDSVFHYNEIFNVNELSQSQPIIEFFTLPKMLGNYDARIILVRLTDVYDSGNYVEVAFRRWAGLDDWASNVTYLSASTNGQNWVGVEGSKLHTDSTYAGLPVYVSMIGESIYDDNGVRRVENVVGKQSMGFYLSGTDVVATVNGKAYGTVCSLDNPSYFSHTWKGFTTGEVTLTIEALEYNVSSEMNLMITKLGGKSMRENGELTDDTPPAIEIDMQGEETVVTAVVDTPYPLYPATAYDLYSKNCRVTSAVYGSYGTTNQFDVEIIERHHNLKKDAPSGTALMLADSVNEAFNGEKTYVDGRSGIVGARDKKEIGMHAVRGGTIVGEHEVMFAGEDEIITISHSARSKRVFAVGAIRAAKFLNGKPAGRYEMKDLLD